MTDTLNHYAILGVPPTATGQDLKLAYELASKRFQPDVNDAPGAALLFKDITRAYEILSDPVKRSEYDASIKPHHEAPAGIEVEAVYSRRNLKKLDEPQLLYVLLKIQALQERTAAEDAALNLCLVIDRSTSMKGPRLQHLKTAVHSIIDECDPEDLLSVVTFSDNAEVLIPAQHPAEPREMKALVSTIRADGATAIYSGLKAGMAQVERKRHPRYVNHIILITDGRTYGDEADCLRLAADAHQRGIGISAMGIGDDWNDRFLDTLASRTGGSSNYISAPEGVGSSLLQRVRSLATAYAERVQMLVAPGPHVHLESVSRISPNPMMLDAATQPIPLGSVESASASRLMLEFHITTEEAELGELYVGRIDVRGELLGTSQRSEQIALDLTATLEAEPAREEPPAELLEALSRLAMYRLQNRAHEALEAGDVVEATRKLEYLATRLFETGAEDLGKAALSEAHRVAHTKKLSDQGAKQLKYGTRALWPMPGDEDD